MLILRIFTAIFLLPLVLYLFIAGPKIGVLIFLTLTAMAATYEAAIMLLPRLDEVSKAIRTTDQPVQVYSHKHFIQLALFAAVLTMVIFVFSVIDTQMSGRGIVVFGLTLAILMAVFATRGIDAEMARVFAYVVSICYGGLPWIVMWDLYEAAPKAEFLLLLLAIVWASDTGAYFGGRFLGRKIFGDRRLAPHKSPKKTWEGAVFGFFAGVIASFIFSHLNPEYFATPWAAGITGAIVGIFGQLGDLVESVFKRFSQVKDSGKILPGHGGILDRVDGLIVAAPALWFMLKLFKVVH